jgi:hypothetical protein
MWTKQQLQVMKALLRMFHRSQVAGIMYAMCVHIGHDLERSSDI